MHIDNQLPTPGRRAHASQVQRWAPQLLRLYPHAWRDRYGDEMASVLAEHRVTYWTALDLILGALDAHLHGDLLPRRLVSMAHRIRSSEITIFCAFVLFCLTWSVKNSWLRQMRWAPSALVQLVSLAQQQAA